MASRLRLAGEAFCFKTTRLLPGLVEVRLSDLSPLIGICANLRDAAMSAFFLRLGSDGFGFEFIVKRADPAFDLGVIGHESKPAAFFDLIA
jgi:hypothetical protein